MNVTSLLHSLCSPVLCESRARAITFKYMNKQYFGLGPDKNILESKLREDVKYECYPFPLFF